MYVCIWVLRQSVFVVLPLFSLYIIQKLVNSEMSTKKRFFKDELESSLETTRSFNTSFDNSKSFLFNPPQEQTEFNNSESSQKSTTDLKLNLDDHNIQNDDDGVEIEIIEEKQLSPIEIFTRSILEVVPSMKMSIISELFNMFSDSSNSNSSDHLLQKALSYYFEHYQSPTPNENKRSHNIPSSPIQVSPFKRKKSQIQQTNKRLNIGFSWKRFIGSLQVTAMATRPTMKPLKYGTVLNLVKQNTGIAISKLYDNKGRQKKMMSSYVKIYDPQLNREIGKVPEDIARMLYPLLETDEVVFEAILVFCDNKRLSIGDNFILQLDCYLTSHLFENGSELAHTQSSQNRIKGYYNNNNNNNTDNGGGDDDDDDITYNGGSNNNYRKLLSQSFKSGGPDKEEHVESKSRRIALITLFKKLRLNPLNNHEENLIKSQDDKYKDNESSDEIIDLEDDRSFEEFTSQTYESQDVVDDSKYEAEETMSLNQLQTFYNSAQSYELLKHLPETEPPSGLLKLTLRPYQKQGLTWMLRREHEYTKAAASDGLEVDNNMMNPLWKQFKWPKDRSWAVNRMKEKSNDDLDSNLFFYANLHTGDFSLEKPILKTMIKGGILSDEMGLGKTISALSLVLMCPRDSKVKGNELFTVDVENRQDFSINKVDLKKPYASKTTLIVVPMSLLNQWYSEFESINNSPDLRADIYYGGNVSGLKKLLTKTSNPPTVILTTYGIVQNEWSKLFRENRNPNVAISSSNGLFSIEFYRIIIDEGHTIRNRSTITSKAVMDLSSKCKWVLTGTPIINRLDDLFSMVKFLKLEPWCNVNYWKTFVSNPFEEKEFKQAFDVVNSIMEPVLLRRTKQMKDANGELLVKLPPKEIIIKKLKLNKTQETVYKYFLDIAENSVKTGLARGDLLKRYSTILVHILRLRQICCDVELLGTLDDNDDDISKTTQLLTPDDEIKRFLYDSQKNVDDESAKEYKELTIAKLKERYPNIKSLSQKECSICTNEDIDTSKMLLTECGHPFCENCLLEYINYQQEKKCELRCPICRSNISQNSMFKPNYNEYSNTLIFVSYNTEDRPAKSAALIENLQQLQDSSSGEQVIVFSQFSSYLDILERELKKVFPIDKAKIYKFDGRLSLKERNDILKEFREKDLSRQKILLLSLKAGGVGLNLTCASYAYMMDPWWSPSMEDQAIDRIHRIGQTNNVKVLRFIIEGSIEEKMLRIQDQKRSIGEVIDTDQEERRRRRIEEIKSLFE